MCLTYCGREEVNNGLNLQLPLVKQVLGFGSFSPYCHTGDITLVVESMRTNLHLHMPGYLRESG